MAQKASGSLTITNITDGANANIWTTSTAPTTPNYTFTISNLTGADDNPRVGDIILQGVYRYTITSIGSTTVLAGSRQSLQGATGAAGGKWYSGTGITGTNTTAQVFSGSGVSSAVVGDMYLNTSTDNVYQCTTVGNASTAKWKYVGNIKGSTGSQGRSVTSVVTEYYRKLSGGSAPTSSTTGSTTIPDYVDGCTYYTRTITNFDSGNPDKSEWVANSGLTNEIKNAYDAWIAAGAAELKVAKIIQNSEGMIVTSGINGGDVTPGTTSTYGYNTLMAPNYLGLRYNAINLAKLTTTESTPALEFYIPSVNSGGTPVQGNKGLSISATALTFYNPSNSTAQLIIGANGTLQSGNYNRGSDITFAEAGTKIDLTYGEIYSPYFRLSQGNEINAGAYIQGRVEAHTGKIGEDAERYWEIGTYRDYSTQQSATILAHGSAFIQLGEGKKNNTTIPTWRLATNRIHTGWYETGDTLLHYPKVDNSLYWDYGLHIPTSTADKFLYIRKAKTSTTSLSNLLSDLEDSNVTHYWDYNFYIDGNGNLYAKNLYFFDDNGNPVQVGGADGAYLPKTGGTITGDLTVNGTITGNLTGTASNAAKVNNLTVQTAVPANAIFTDKNVRSIQANTTKIWLVGTPTAGDRTGEVNYDSNVYLTDTAGVLHATTFEGNLSGTATKANQDGDGNVIKTTYLKLSGGNVTGAVTFGSSISAASASIVDLVVTGNASFTNGLSGNLTGTASRATADSDGNQINNTYLKKSGGTMTGTVVFSTTNAIGYQGTQANYSMIRFKDNTNDSYGNGIIIGGGGLTVIGGGESADTMAAQYAGGDEVLALGSDGAVYIYTNLQNGWTDRKTFTFGTDGVLVATGFSGSGASLTSLNASNISSGTLAAARLPSSGVTAGSYGPSTNAEPGYGSTFNVPYVTVDTYGRVTSISTKTIKIPTSDNTNTWRPVVDNLTSTATDQSLSAAQGKILNESKLSLTGGQVTGPVTFGDSVSIDDLTVGQLIVNGSANFVNGLTTTTVNGYTPAAAMAKGVVTSIDTSANLPTSNAVKTFVENKGYVTSSGVTSVTVAATSPVQSSTGTAQTGSSVSTTISLKDGYGDTKNPYASKTANYVLAAPNGSNGAPSFRALVAADIPSLSWNKITSNKPTTSSGYGITDAIVDIGSNDAGQLVLTFSNSTTDTRTVSITATSQSSVATAEALNTGGTKVGDTNKPVYFGTDGKPAAISYTIDKSVPSDALFTDTWNAMTGATSTANGTVGYINSTPPKDGYNTKFWRADGTWAAPVGTTYTFDGTYNTSSNKAATVSTVTNAINNLDVTAITGTTGQTITSISETNGKISVTYSNISITKSQISDFPSSMTPAAHTHDDRYYTETEIDNRLKKYIPFAHYSNRNGSNSGKYYKISINSYTHWMLNFTVKLYHEYKAYDLQISGYNYGSNHWHEPKAVVLGSTVTSGINVSFGYTEDFHLWVAIPAAQYTGIGVYGVTNGYTQVDSWEDLFTIEMVEGMPTTLQTTITAYRPWYRNETVTAATKASQDEDGNVIKTTYLKLAGGNVTGTTTFGSSVSINSLFVADMTCTGNASFTNGLSGNLTGNVTGNLTGNVTGNLSGLATKATQDADGNDIRNKYVQVFNASNMGGSSAVSFVDLAAAGNAVGLIYDATDNPKGSAGWVHGISLCWTKGSSSNWISQIALGATDSNGMWYRTTSGNVAGLAWKRVLDSSNYTTYTVQKDGTGASGTWGISISGNAANVTGTVTVGHGGTGVTTLASGELLIGNGTGAVTTRGIRNNTSAGTLGWSSTSVDIVIPTVNTIAYWNGAYNGTNSNLAYCNKGAFGTAATYTAATSVGNNSNLPTGAAVQTYVSGVVGNYVTLNTDQTITASQKTFNGAIRWGTTSKYGATYYDSTLEALVFSFI